MTKHLPLAFNTELWSFKVDKSEMLISMSVFLNVFFTVSNASNKCHYSALLTQKLREL